MYKRQVYTLQPIELLKTYGTTSVVGFAMFICGILSVAMFQQFESEAIWDGMTWLGLFAIIILGTVVSFNAYMEGVKQMCLRDRFCYRHVPNWFL